MNAVAVTELAGAVPQIQIVYVISPPGHTLDWPRAMPAVTQMTAGFGVGLGLGLGELEVELGVLDGDVLGFWLGVDDVLCDVLGDGLGVDDASGTAENTAVDPAAHGEWADRACPTACST